MRLSPRLTWWLAGFAIWTALALLGAAETLLGSRKSGRDVAATEIVRDRLVDWYSYGIFVPLFVVAVKRFPVDRQHVAARLLLHVGLAVAAVIGRYILVYTFAPYLGQVESKPLLESLQSNLVSSSLALLALDGVIHALEFYGRYRDREKVALQLRASLSDARLAALRAQLNPHFLFNTLSAAATLVYRDPRATDRMLTQLADLLRAALNTGTAHEVRLSDELALLERYLGIMAIRFEGHVTVGRNVDPAVMDALVPAFLLQPLVENAYEHGVSDLQRPGRIFITARRVGDKLHVGVSDNGRGLTTSRADDGGVGLTNTRRRLAELYDDRASLEITPASQDGTALEVRIPFRVGEQRS